MHGARLADAEGAGRVERGGGNEYGGEADERMEGGDQLRHGRHGDAARGDGADDAADAEAGAEQDPGERQLRVGDGEGRGHGDEHAEHAGIVAAPRGGRARQAAQGENEQDAGDEIEPGDEIGRQHFTLPPWALMLITACRPSSCTWRACAG